MSQNVRELKKTMEYANKTNTNLYTNYFLNLDKQNNYPASMKENILTSPNCMYTNQDYQLTASPISKNHYTSGTNHYTNDHQQNHLQTPNNNMLNAVGESDITLDPRNNTNPKNTNTNAKGQINVDDKNALKKLIDASFH